MLPQIGKELHFKVKVQNARGLPNKYSSVSDNEVNGQLVLLLNI